MIKPKCKGCEDRHPGCHSSCEFYKEFRCELEEEKRVKRNNRYYGSYGWSYQRKRK